MKNKLLKLLIIIVILGALGFGFFFFMNKPVSSEESVIEITINAGTNKLNIINQLDDDNIIRNRFAGYLYLLFKPGINMQAGIYNIDTSHSMTDIIDQIGHGKTNKYADTIRITFKEGKTFRDLARIIDTNFEFITYDDFVKKCANKEFLKELINEYWFLDDSILKDGIYFPLEGYLFPQTYDFYMNASIEDIVKMFLNQTDKQLSPYKEELQNSNYSIHELLTVASIAEKEANTKEDREKVSQVIYKRLDMKMNLGMDTTTYYSVGKEMTEYLTKKDLNVKDGYNTRNMEYIGLPVGPICNPSLESILSALNPSDTSYLYFYAVSGKDYFFNSSDEFYNFQKNLKS